MKPFEDELRSLLRRQEPPEGFARRVLDRLKSRPKPRSRRFWNVRPMRPAFRWAAAAALVCALLGMGVARYRERQRDRGRMARAEVILALRITTAQLDGTFRKALLAGAGTPGVPSSRRRDDLRRSLAVP
ncbi:MAG: hypothetical protein ACRD18_02750 [Terriglobia bacterium]